MSGQMRCLLDKVTARRILEGLLKLAEARELTDDEIFALDFFERAAHEGLRLFIVPPTHKVLRQLHDLPRYAALIEIFLTRVELASPTRYFKRWARRVQDYGFTPEDANVLALATFCTGQEGDFLGVHTVVTFDQPMMHHWELQRSAIQEHLTTMRKDLPEPYRSAALPHVLHPAQVSV
jgi:hypothetical protein